MQRTVRALSAMLLATLVAVTSACSQQAPGGSGTPAASASMTPATTTPATNGPHGNAIEELIGQEWRFTSGEEDDASYFVLQPGGALTWFTYLIGASDWAEDDTCTWTTEGNAITLTVNDGFATMTGTLEDGKFTGTGTNQDGLTYIWTAEPASPPRVP